jgi:hypothetical protein
LILSVPPGSLNLIVIEMPVRPIVLSSNNVGAQGFVLKLLEKHVNPASRPSPKLVSIAPVDGCNPHAIRQRESLSGLLGPMPKLWKHGVDRHWRSEAR